MFRCRKTLWRDDVFLEHIEVRMNFDMQSTYSRVSGMPGVMAIQEPHLDYPGALYEYSCRYLSHDADILNAFAGIFSLLQRMSNGRTPKLSEVYGLPIYFFDWAILWAPHRMARRRSGGGPSWSWSGWIGQMRMMVLNNLSASQLEDWLSHHTWIRWIIYDLDGQLLMHLSSSSTYQREVTRFPPINYPESLPASADKVQAMIALSGLRSEPILRSPLALDGNGYSPLLHFTTLSTHFRLAPTEFLHNFKVMRRYNICDAASGEPYGIIDLDRAWHHNPDTAYEFIILSDAKCKDVDHLDSASDWDGFHVMMIDWQAYEVVAERVAIGILSCEAINEAADSGTKWKEIWLR